jgi:acyl-coenzyme A synthetase/AMP-(fatty) acid ligase
VLLPPSRTAAAVAELQARYPGSDTVNDAFEATAGGRAPSPVEEAQDDFIAVIGHTSGSTGAPAAHAKSFRSLAATTALNAGILRAELERRGKTGQPWIVATVPPQHMYGLETSVLLPLLAGFGVHGARPLLPADVAASLSDVPAPRVLVSTPVHLRALIESAAVFPEIAVVVSATAPLDRELATRIEERLGAPLIEFFGSTETCVIATRRTAREDAWRPYSGVELVAAAGGTRVRAPWLAIDQLLHDIVELRADGSFTIVGRGSDVIEVAGKRASLADLARRLMSIEGVEDAVVFQPPAAHSGIAGRCAALVVAPGLSGREISRRLRAQVDAVFVPRPIVIVTTLPRNEVGKLPRERLLQALATASASRPRRGT